MLPEAAAIMKRVLVIAPHPDDESIGCGGALWQHTSGGDCVIVVFLTSGELGLKHLPPEQAWRIREGEAEAAGKVLGVQRIEFLRYPDWYVCDRIAELSQTLIPILKRETPDVIYLPHAREWHPDHQAALPAILGALQQSVGLRPKLKAYEI